MELTRAVRTESLENLQLLIEREKNNINVQNEKGVTPLIAAIAVSKPRVVELLLQNGANPNFTKENATLPLIFAIDSAIEEEDYDEDVDEMRTDIIELLLKYGADPEKEDLLEECSPFEYAKGRHVKALEIFEKIKKSKA